jgi:signal recognition particle receptor subunit beta
MVDSNDKESFNKLSTEILSILNEELLKKIPVLILANKQDLNGAYSPSELIECLKLKNIKQNWSIFPCVATTGEGIIEGLEQMKNLRTNQ